MNKPMLMAALVLASTLGLPPSGGRLHAQELAASEQALTVASTRSDLPSDAAPADAAEVQLEELIEHALSANPSIRAAQDRIEAARAAIGPADALPDPMLSAGVMNFPTGEPGFENMMTMKTIGIGQTLPFPGKLPLQRRIAEYELAATAARLEAAQLAVVEEVKDAYYEMAFLDQAVEIIQRNERLLGNFIQATEARYGVGTGSQADVLKARVEASRLAEEAVALVERRRAALARLNAVLDRPTDTPVEAPAIPLRTARAAVSDDAREIRFASAALGSRAADSPLPSLGELQEWAVRQSPTIRAHEAEIAAEAARVELARKAHLPNFDVSVQYGQRNGASDFVSAMVSVPLPLHKGSKQDLAVKEAEARLSALKAEHHQHANDIRAQVADAYADLERDRAQLGLFVKSVLPQSRAALESATASFQVGQVDFMTLLENQATLYDYEAQYYRALSSFAGRLAALERTVGKEIL